MMLLCSLNFIIASSILGFVSSDDLKNESRQPRIFTFNADSEDVEVGFDFSIPFLKIPFKKTINAVAQFGFPGISIPKINLNPMALMLGGLLIISTSIFAPLLNKATAWHHLDRNSRSK
ncbi:jg19444 [Pararge aegeria aegeria]|uniref:Jg19444 protein n=1 Tax=Pararge aegeria aegeria TaxID=348720 RepID=A0A8S4RZN3_9NEOP|nr:jg19444 [Pararge aegeria aegeria]